MTAGSDRYCKVLEITNFCRWIPESNIYKTDWEIFFKCIVIFSLILSGKDISQWGLNYPIRIISLSPAYPILPSSKSDQATKVGYCYIDFHIFHFIPLSLNKISFQYHKNSITKTYSASLDKHNRICPINCRLLNQFSNKSDNFLQEAPHKLV